jgi:RimJ/RimL family protein N-acetyltransferase
MSQSHLRASRGKAMTQVDPQDVTLMRLTGTAKNVKWIYEMLKRQPREHYQAWGYGEPSLKSVRELLSSNSVFAVLLKGDLVGIIGFTYKSRYFIQLYSGQYWIHYLVDKAYGGRGIATVAMQKFLKWLREETELTRIYAGIFTYNPTSIHVVKKFGFVKRDQRGDTLVFEKIIHSDN